MLLSKGSQLESTRPSLNAGIMLAVLALLVFSRAVPASASSASVSTCSPSVLEDGVQSATASINQETAVDTAAPTVASYTATYAASFDSVHYDIQWTPECSVQLIDVSVDYYLVQGNVPKYVLEVNLNPSLTAVLSSTLYPAAVHGSYRYDDNYVGPEYQNNSGLEQSGAYWDVPTVAGNGYTGECATDGCDFAFWVGQQAEPSYLTANYIAQTGTDSECTSECSDSSYNHYDLWYEFFDANLEANGATDCDVSVGANDEIFASVGGDSSHDYSTYIFDYHSDEGCSASSPSGFDMGEAYWSEYMGESPIDQMVLPEFDTLTVWDGYYHDSSDNFYLISSSWANMYLMNDNTMYPQTCDGISDWDINVCPTSPSSGNFTETWLTSSGF